jgi:uncharacterized membrane protein
MLNSVLASSPIEDVIVIWIEWTAMVIELLAVVIIALAIIGATACYIYRHFQPLIPEEYYQQLRISLGRSLLVGLEILIAADVIRTVALEATLQSVVILGMLVLVRTFLSWTLVIDIEDRWPWQPKHKDS